MKIVTSPHFTKPKEQQISRLANEIDWPFLENCFYENFVCTPNTSPRLILGMLYLQDMLLLESEVLIDAWQKSPALRRFCGIESDDCKFPLPNSTLNIWRRDLAGRGETLMIYALLPAHRYHGAGSYSDLIH